MRAFKTLRDFLQLLEAEQQLLRITEEVRLEPDLAAAACALTQLGETSPAIHFDRIKGYQNACVVLNVHGSWPNQALMLGMAEENTDPDKYPEPFRLKPEDLANFPVVPTIPPLRRR